MKKLIVLAGVAVGMAAAGQQPFNWWGPTYTLYNGALEGDGNWMGGGVPDEGTYVQFPSGAYTVTTATGFTNNYANFGYATTDSGYDPDGEGKVVTLDFAPGTEYLLSPGHSTVRDGTVLVTGGRLGVEHLYLNVPGTQLIVDGATASFVSYGPPAIGLSMVSSSLIIRDGGYGFIAGRVGIGGSGSLVEVTGTNAAGVASALDVYNGGDSVTLDGSYNTLRVTDGARYFGSGWLVLGNYGSYNSLVITNGGSASFNNTVVLGRYSSGGVGATGNTILVDGTNSTLTVYPSLAIGGEEGWNNTATVSGGAQVFATHLYVGCHSWNERDWGPPVVDTTVYSTGGGNALTVSGEGTSVIIEGALNIGAHGDGNAVLITDGAFLEVESTPLLIGAYGAGKGNALTVASGAQLCMIQGYESRSVLGVGNLGAESVLRVCDGGWINLGGSIILGNSGNATSNLMEVCDGGVVTMTADIRVGWGSYGNTLRLCNGTIQTSGYKPYWIGDITADGSIRIANDGRLEVAGTNSWLSAVESMTFTNGATLAFAFDATPPVRTPIEVKTLETQDETARLEVDATALSRVGGAKGIVLVQLTAPYPSLDGLNALADNVTFVTGSGSVYVDVVNNALVCDVASTMGTVILVR